MKSRVDLDNLGRRILLEARTELYMAMHFMARALDSLPYEMDLRTQRIGTDGEKLRFNPEFLLHLFIESPQKLNRLYMHLLLHCIFRHPYSGDDKEKGLWDISCDIHVESVLDSMEYPIIKRPPGERRQHFYEELEKECRVLTAERLYRHFSENRPDIETLWELQQEFTKDDHRFWVLEGGSEEKPVFQAPADDMKSDSSGDENGQGDKAKDRKESGGDGASGIGDTEGNKDNKPEKGDSSAKGESPESHNTKKRDRDSEKGKSSSAAEKAMARRMQQEEKWKENGERLKSELSTLSPEKSDELGSMLWQLELSYKHYTDFKDFLRLVMVEREDIRIDPESFDLGYYNYGMSIYGNMPLIEENEYQEARRIDSLVIAIDTSASCKDVLVQSFLNQIAGMLSQRESFFKRTEIHIIECDDRVQQDIVIRDVEEIKKYSDGFSLRGGYGTDFRPVFSEVESLQRKGELTGLRGLLYFTDGYGSYPKKPTSYRTAFVYPKDEDYSDKDTPAWALRLYI